MLLPNTDGPGAMLVAIAIRDQVSGLRIHHSASRHKGVTVSLGVATAVPYAGMTADSLVRDADAALYRAKEQGRNVICVGNVVPISFEPQIGRAG